MRWVLTVYALAIALAIAAVAPALGAEVYAPTLVFGSEGNGTGQFGGTFTAPWGISVDDIGMIYVADTDNNRIEIFLQDGTFLDAWVTDPVWGIKTPHGIVVSPDHSSVHVADSSQSRILKFDVFGSLLDSWYVSPAPGGVQTPSYPVGIARGPDGRIWVTEETYGQGIVRVYSPEGDEVWSFFCNDARGIAVADSDNVYVSSSAEGRIYRYSQQGRYLMRFGEPGSGPGQFDHPNGVAVDAAGNVYVADSGNHRVQKFDSGGHYVTSFGTRGTGAGQFEYPEGVAVGPNGDVYVTDRNCRVQRFSCAALDPVTPPAAAYWFGAGSGEAPFGVQFADGSSGNPTSWLWEFGDGTESTEENPYHVFTTAGTYSPKLTVRNTAGVASVTLGDQKITITESPYRFVQRFGSAGTGEGELTSPRGLALDAGNNLYTVDRETHRVTRFSPDGTYLSSFGREGNWSPNPAIDEFMEPRPIALDGFGRIYIGDDGYGRIKVFSPDGTPLSQFGLVTGVGRTLQAMTIGPDGTIYTLTSEGIAKYYPNGSYIASISTIPPGVDPGYWGNLLGLACDAQGDLWVLDPGSGTMMVRQYRPDGTFVSGWGRRGTSLGELNIGSFSQFRAIAIDHSGNVYVTGDDSSISTFALDGTFITKFGAPGTGDGQIGSPVALTVDATGCVYVASWDGRVQKFAPADGPVPTTPTPVKPVPGGNGDPTSIGNTGRYDDVNGNGRPDFADVVLYFNQMSWIAANEPVTAFDYNGNGRIDFADVVWLFTNL